MRSCRCSSPESSRQCIKFRCVSPVRPFLFYKRRSSALDAEPIGTAASVHRNHSVRSPFGRTEPAGYLARCRIITLRAHSGLSLPLVHRLRRSTVAAIAGSNKIYSNDRNVEILAYTLPSCPLTSCNAFAAVAFYLLASS